MSVQSIDCARIERDDASSTTSLRGAHHTSAVNLGDLLDHEQRTTV